MNFFGHVVAASWTSREAGFGLGSMLPDFATMIGAHLVATSHEPTRGGVEWHHETDAAFHRHSIFRTHSHQLTDLLAERGIGRGGSLAAGHIGVELLLDGLLLEARHREAESLYLEALEALDRLGPSIELKTRRPHAREPRERLAELGRLLAKRGLPHGYRDPAVVAKSVLRVLASRPRLAIDRAKQDVLTETFAEILPALARESTELIDDLRAALIAGADANPDGPDRSAQDS